MRELPTKPYLIRALYEWCADSGLTAYLKVTVDEHTRVPMEYVKEGEIVLNISAAATRNLTISNDVVQFSARFSGVSRELYIPLDAITGIFARENGQGMFFPQGKGKMRSTEEAGKVPGTEPKQADRLPKGRPKLQIIK
jgi:stringent starvation protein B